MTTSRRDLELQLGDIQDWAQREAMERRMGDSLLRWLGLDKPPQHRVRHKVWKKQLVDSTRQLKLGADRARQRTELEVLDGTEVITVVNGAGAEPVAEGGVLLEAAAGSAAEAGGHPAADAEGVEDGQVWEEWE